MPVSGPTVHQQLILAYQQAQQELEKARGQVAAAGAEMTELTAHRSEAIVSLAQYYLPELTQETVQRISSEAQQAIYSVLLRKDEHARRLIKRLSQMDSQRESAEQQLQSISSELDQALERQAELLKQVSDQLAADSDFKSLSDKAAQAESALQRAEANLAEIEQDVRKKLPDYQNSSLFMYLQKQKFLTPDYKAKGLTRSIDQWLARYIDYRQARQGYDFLISTPVHMREVIAEDRAALNTVMNELERRRDETAGKLGVPQAIATSENLTARRQAVLQQLSSIEQDTKTTQSERTEIENPQGPYYREAIAKFRDLLSTTDPQVLAARARQTPEIEDDQIVARLQGMDAEIGNLGSEVKQQQRRLEALTSHLQACGNLVSRFRAAGFDSQRAQFNGSIDVVQQLRMAREGQANYEGIWQSLKRGQSWGPSAMDEFTRVATHPMTQVLLNAMVHAAAGALESRARDAANRRSSSRSQGPTGGSFGGGFGGGFGGFGGGSSGGGSQSSSNNNSGGFYNRESV